MGRQLIKVAKELNVGMNTILDFLHDKGFEVENKPNAKISDAMYDNLMRKFSDSKAEKLKADQIIIGTRPIQPRLPTPPERKTIDLTPHLIEKTKEKRPAIEEKPKFLDETKAIVRGTHVIPSVVKGKNYLLSIGIDQYADKDIPKLSNAVRDIKHLEEVLTQHYDFHLHSKLTNEQAHRTAVLDALEELESLTEQDNLIVFFSGHGYKKTKSGYIVPYDGKNNKTSDYISYTLLKEAIEELKVYHFLLILDCCYAGSALKRMEGKAAFDKPSRRILAASSPEETAEDGFIGRNSPFTDVLAEVLKENLKEELPVKTLFSDLRNLMNEKGIRQVPVEGVWQMESNRGGEFIFKKKIDFNSDLPSERVNVYVESVVRDRLNTVHTIKTALKLSTKLVRNIVDTLPGLLFENVEKQDILSVINKFEELGVQYRLEPYKRIKIGGVVKDIFPNYHTQEGDDLTVIEGIGPNIAEVLIQAGITTFIKLSETEIGNIKEILEKAGPRFSIHNPNTWAKQSELAAAGKWDELELWQTKHRDELKNK